MQNRILVTVQPSLNCYEFFYCRGRGIITEYKAALCFPGGIMRLLLIEDDKKLCHSLSFYLERQGFTVDICHDGEEGLLLIREQAYDLILLDRMLPSLDGASVLKKARAGQIHTPVILLTALGEVSDRIEGLNCGADDYMVKPFDFEELTARIHCISRRPSRWENSERLSFGDIAYDVLLHELSGNGKKFVLSKREGDLIEFFLRNPGQSLPRPLILSRVWGPDAPVEEGNLDNYIHFIRRRLQAVSSHVTLRTIRGIGYCLENAHK